MPLLVGVILALVSGLLGAAGGLDRDRAFYPTMLIVVGSYYSLFAVMGGSTHAVVVETLIGGVFLAAALLGFRSSLWIAVLGLAGHGVFDFTRGGLVANPGVPAFWPAFCGAFDVVAAVFLAWRLRSGRVQARGAGAPAPGGEAG